MGKQNDVIEKSKSTTFKKWHPLSNLNLVSHPQTQTGCRNKKGTQFVGFIYHMYGV